MLFSIALLFGIKANLYLQQPYRPAFAAAHRGNENLPPVTGKTLHQRHKSTGSLLSANPSQTNIPVKRNDIKAGVKPAVFQDVAMPPKNTGLSVGQENRSNVSKDAFLQPAQRLPKALVPAASMNNIRSVAQDLLPKPLNKPTKRNAPIAVYNDNQPAKDVSNKHLKEARPTTQQSSASSEFFDAPMYPGEQGWVNVEPQQASSEDRLQGFHMDNTQISAQSEHNASYSTASQAAELSLTYQGEDDVPEAPYLDAVEDLPNDTYPALHADKSENWEPIPGDWERGLSRSITSEEGQTVEIKPSDLQASRPSSVPIDDQADLSDYEDDEYDDQGYTTAHSVRDNTTGGVTIVIAPPKLTKRGAAEIATAREIVESRRAGADPDDDESWDISMVIEYGEEIFQYMREVEVSYNQSDLGRRNIVLTFPL